MNNNVYLPFYMTYPVRTSFPQENRAARDIEYLRELYPQEAKKLLNRIAEVIDKMDYEESMIYDEYPDRWQLYRLAESIVKILKNEAEEKEESKSPEMWEWISDMIQILLFDEIFNRRHGEKKGHEKGHIYMPDAAWKNIYGELSQAEAFTAENVQK